jgi:TM2 domain-containing membrane protein YozV
MTTPPNTPTTDSSPSGIGYLALILAWLVPGLGHFLLGQKARGIVFALTIHSLFALGMLVAGIRAINPPEQAIWTYTQFLTGWPMLVSNRIEKIKTDEFKKLQETYLQQRPNERDDSPERLEARKKYGREFIENHPIFANHPKTQDIGAVYCGIAGMLNLLVMFDVLLRITGSQRETPTRKKKSPDPQTPASPSQSPGGAP